MLTIRLSRLGHRNLARYRVIVQEHAKAPSSKNVEILGHYDPTADPVVFEINKKRLAYWREKGAQVSETVARLLGEAKPHPETRKQAEAKVKAAAKKEVAKVVKKEEKPAEAKPKEKPAEKEAEEEKPAEPKKEEPKEAPPKDSDKPEVPGE